MLGGHVAGYFAGVGKFPDREFALQHKLYHPQSYRMSQGPQAFGSLLQILHFRQFDGASGFHIYIISEYRDMSIHFSRKIS